MPDSYGILVVLGLFLELRLALWVMMGMAASFIGASLFMPALGVSINMIFQFAFLLVLKTAARSLGVSEEELARQVRGVFFGAEALRQQRRRNELRVSVRLPRAERESECSLSRSMQSSLSLRSV